MTQIEYDDIFAGATSDQQAALEALKDQCGVDGIEITGAGVGRCPGNCVDMGTYCVCPS